ncbi:MAG TPA: hypothetical protein VLK22_04270 [Candidatus Udaeobacter sp.]|nr:hypothetical protein [Candidatus Udaeobacter sp.]
MPKTPPEGAPVVDLFAFRKTKEDKKGKDPIPKPIESDAVVLEDKPAHKDDGCWGCLLAREGIKVHEVVAIAKQLEELIIVKMKFKKNPSTFEDACKILRNEDTRGIVNIVMSLSDFDARKKPSYTLAVIAVFREKLRAERARLEPAKTDEPIE